MRKRGVVWLLAGLLTATTALAGEPVWQAEFSRLCGNLETAETLSATELHGLAGDCARLAGSLRAQGEEANKVYVLRLERCRKFYEYLAEVKETR